MTARLPVVLALALNLSTPAALAQTAGDGPWSASGGITLVHQRETSDGANDTSVSGDLVLNWQTGSGSWLLYIEGASGTDADSIFNVYPEINGDANSVLDRNGGGHVQISELHYSLRIADRYTLMIGQIDPSAQIDRSRIANDENTQFLGASFVNNPTIEFPDYTLGAMLRREHDGASPEVTLMLTSSDGIADNPSRSYRELIDVSGAGKGLFAALGARWFRGDTEIGLGAWLRTDDHPVLNDPSRQDQNYGAYAVYGTVLGTTAVNLRAGISNDRVSPATRFVSLAAEQQAGSATLGLGIARILESSRARRPTSGDTNHAEAWARLPLRGDSLHATVSLQYVSNPGFDRSGVSAEAHALFAGLRLDYAF